MLMTMERTGVVSSKCRYIFWVILLTYGGSVSLGAKTFKISAPLESKQTPEIERLISEAYQELDINPQIVRMPAKRALAESSKNSWVDAELVRVAEAEKILPNFIRIPVPLMTLKVSSYSLKTNVEVNSWQSLKGLNVVTLRGFIGITNQLKKYDINFHQTSTMQQAIQMLKVKRMDTVILPEILFSKLKPEKLFKEHEVYKQYITQFEVFHYIHKRHHELVPKLTLEMQKNFTKAQD